MRLFRWLLASVLAVMAGAQEPGLVRLGDPWRVRSAFGPGAPVAADWRALGFDDAAWVAGGAGFGLSSYSGEATVLPPAPAGGAVCLRANFQVSDPEAVVWVVLRVDWDGGFVAWLNGTEIARQNLPGNPGQPVPFETLPAARYRGGADELACPGAERLLRPGPNVLAVQWHPSPGYSSAGIVPELLANFTRGPYVQNSTPTSQTLVWRTPVAASTEVAYGETPALERRVVVGPLETNHVAVLDGLQPGTLYHYEVRSAASDRRARSPKFQFRTPPARGALRFAVAADVGGGGAPQQAVATVLREAAPDLVLMAGDLVYPRFTDRLADEKFFSIYRRQMTATPFFVVAGNHDTLYGPPDEFFAAYVCPTNPTPLADHLVWSTGPEYYYSFDYADAHFAAVYAPLYYRGLEVSEGSPQWRWLEADLAASRQPWKFIFLHHPLMSSGPHGDDDHNANGLTDNAELAASLLSLARRHGVQMIFSGHDHAYERFRPVETVHCLVTGGGGGSLYSQYGRHPASAQFHYAWNCVVIEVAGDTLHLQARDQTGTVFDEAFIQRALPAPRAYPAAWHTPVAVFGSGAEPDGDGNRVGQRFDFAGEPIPTRPGAFSNLGRVWVNHDHDQLYLGFERVMIPDAGNVFVFLETPGRSGVTTLAGLGNGVVDPDGEAVDGLDFLENPAFVDFRPAVACLLGDEFADGTFRGFPRTNIITSFWTGTTVITNLALPVGQGVFDLAPGFPDVPGTRVAQFNRSPQTLAVPGEQNADFMAVAIPLAALGLRGGETFRLGAVVAGGGYSTNAGSPGREIDLGFLGDRAGEGGLGATFLTGLAVRLGPDQDPDGDGLTSAEEAALGTRAELADSDGDGLPDGWEHRHGLDPLSPAGDQGAGGDPDRDGAVNAAEHVAGTEPDNPGSVFRLNARRGVEGNVELVWTSVPGRRYRLEGAPQPAGDYVPLAGAGFPRVATGPTERAMLPRVPEAGFYRIRVEP